MSISLRLGRHHDDGDPRPGAQLAAHVDPRHAGKPDVEQDQVGLAAVEELEPLDAVPGHLDQEPFPLQAHRERLDEGLLVLNDQDGGRIRHGGPPRKRGWVGLVNGDMGGRLRAAPPAGAG